MSSPRVFISYSHDSPEHREWVLSLSERLRKDGIETILDRYVNGTPEEGWPRWMMNSLDRASHVLVVCTETYYRRFRGNEDPSKGKGVDWEGALITTEIYNAKSKTLKFVPVFASVANEAHVPDPLRSLTHYVLVSEQAYQALYDFLLDQAGIQPGQIGDLRRRERTTATPLTFDSADGSTNRVADISRILRYAPEQLVGRESELKLLSDAWDKVDSREKGRPHVLIFVALGGEGKTSLVAKWAAELAGQDWPGCDAAFAWSFYSQGTREQMAASSDLFLKEALTFLGDDADKQFAASSAGAFEKGQRLARIVSQRRTLLILDGLEPLQYSTSSTAFKPGELKDQAIAKLLKDLAATNRGLCIVTTRVEIPDLQAFKGGAVVETHLKRLPREAAVRLLKLMGVKGSERRNIPLNDAEPGSEMVNEFEKLVEDVKGHALTLTLLGGFLKRAFHGDIRQRDRVKFAKADEKIDGGHAFRTMAAYEQWLLRDGGDEGRREVAVLRLMGLFDRPADAGCLAALRSETILGVTEPLATLADEDWEFCLSGLEATKLITVNRDASGAPISLDAHPHLREYFAKQLREHNPDAWSAAHRRLYEHLCTTTKEGEQPTLEDLQPLYQAVAHGCQGGVQTKAYGEVWRARIERGDEKFSTRKLGAFGSELGALASFFEEPWKRASSTLSEWEQAFLLNSTAICLRALGRLIEAREPIRAATNWALGKEDWAHASVGASNLSELELTLGEVAMAVDVANQAVTYADRSGAVFHRFSKSCTLADALHQAGHSADAERRFREAEEMHREDQPQYPLLYSLAGYRYCDLLLDVPERIVWRTLLSLNSEPSSINSAVSDCRKISRRAAQTLKWVESWQMDILSASLDHLAVGRATHYAALLSGSSPATHHSSLENAVAGLRRAGTTHHIPRALLTRAWVRFVGDVRTGPESAQEDLEEAWEIAERGPMKLFLADICLHRARLFFREAKYPWESPAADLAAAEKLINACGYHRRDQELADAKRAILGS
jgi:tetratricopeptide (TPR) repeat protein